MITDVGSKRLTLPRKFFSHWDITSQCNYRCGYCTYENRNEPFYDYADKLKIIHFYDYLYLYYDVDLILFGGEPTLDPDFIRIVERLDSSMYPLQIFTNLSQPISWFKELYQKRRRIRFIASYHYGVSNIKEFMNKVVFLLDHFYEVYVKVMWNSNYKAIIKEIYNMFMPLKLAYSDFILSIDKIWHPDQDFNELDMEWYLEEQRNNHRLQTYYEVEDGVKRSTSFNEIKLNCNGIANYKGMECDCGAKNLSVCSNGDVHYCLTFRKNHYPPLFNIVQDNYIEYKHLFEKSIICPHDNCYSEVAVPKRLV
jgi:MoaA/NifB/PqqE/SkfB family radical SAM enzyme